MPLIKIHWLDRYDEKVEFRVGGDSGKVTVQFSDAVTTQPSKTVTIEEARALYRSLLRAGWKVW